MAPTWVTTSVGIYAILGSIMFLVMIVVVGYMIYLLAQLAKQVQKLTGKVEGLTDKVHAIADQVKTVTTDVGVRTSGIVRIVDESAHGAIRTLELLAPALVVFGAIMKFRKMFKRH